MKIKVKGFHNFREAIGDHLMLEMEVGKSTIRDVLDELSNKFGADFKDLLFDPKTKGVRNNNVILLNGVAYTHRLDSELKEGDEIALFPVVSGG